MKSKNLTRAQKAKLKRTLAKAESYFRPPSLQDVILRTQVLQKYIEGMREEIATMRAEVNSLRVEIMAMKKLP